MIVRCYTTRRYVRGFMVAWIVGLDLVMSFIFLQQACAVLHPPPPQGSDFGLILCMGRLGG